MVVLFVGRLVSKKGADVVVGAARSSYHVLLVGERGNVEIGNRPGVELRPFVERKELAELMRACDVFALPSRGEGFPLAAQEAMASGLAVILSNDPSYLAQVDPGAADFIEPDAISLADRLSHFDRVPGERLELGRRARENALRMWSLPKCRQALIDVYRQLQATGSLSA
jgi:glycosyltransferase involved in cell wall biosynthesis